MPEASESIMHAAIRSVWNKPFKRVPKTAILGGCASISKAR
jgi:hypothetical protein